MFATTNSDPVSPLGHIGIAVGCLALMAPLLWLAWYIGKHYLKPGNRAYYQARGQVVVLGIGAAICFTAATASLATI